MEFLGEEVDPTLGCVDRMRIRRVQNAVAQRLLETAQVAGQSVEFQVPSVVFPGGGGA